MGHHGDEIRLRLPSYAWPGMGYDQAAGLLDYCEQVEAGPYEDIWVIDHLLVSKGVYGVSWIDSLVVLSPRRGSPRVGLGTAALVLPLRHPVILAKEIASIHLLSGGRFRFGVAVGWDPAEFEAVGVPLASAAAAPTKLFNWYDSSSPRRRSPSAGDSGRWRPSTPDSPNLPAMGGGWLVDPCTRHPRQAVYGQGSAQPYRTGFGLDGASSGSDPGDVKRDWQVVRSHLVAESAIRDDLVFAATQFLHVTEAGSRAEALEDQIPGFLEVMGDHRTVEDLQAST